MDPMAKARLMTIINEELAWGDVGLAITLGLCQFHGPWIQQTGDKDLIERFCSPDKPTIGCWADGARPRKRHRSADRALLSDPALKANCSARKEGDEYVISGQKAAWVSNGSIADIAVVFCALDQSQGFKGGGVFLVPLDLPGVSRPKPLDKLGQRSLNQGEIYFDEVRIPASYMALGPEFYSIGLETMLAHANAAMGQLFVGVARAALDHAIAYAKERVQGGVPIFQHQSVKARLFKMFMKVEAARSLTRRVSLYNAASPPLVQYRQRIFITNTASRWPQTPRRGTVTSREHPIEKLRDARVDD
jgi:alkylation response protein AidB-like acyl-CoA dehydrogenase